MTDSAKWLRELQHSWPVLHAGRRSEIVTVPLPAEGTVPSRAGVDGAGARHLLVPIGDEQVTVDAVEGAVTTTIRTYTFSGRPLRYLDVCCGRPDLFDLFDEVLVDVLGAIEPVPGEQATIALEIVERWRALFATHRARRLTLVAQMSLFAELTVLDLVTRDAELDLSWWRGPRREPHDIVMPTCALEVKAIGAATTSIEIHGVAQLDPPGVPLALVLAEIAETDDGARLPDVVDRLLERATQRGQAIRLLAAAGYVESDADHYQERFSATEILHAEVNEAMPRIVADSFGPGGPPAGVDRVNYRVDLDAIDGLAARGESALRDWARSVG
ncbi:PD-(D/E)XK motif protein [Pseudonocardia sp.]|uniref:PD-(D/E)XK motif protein n=1 Tax=Pseudonocardia sp. TaxID=60912 RepID=UPI003D119D8D